MQYQTKTNDRFWPKVWGQLARREYPKLQPVEHIHFTREWQGVARFRTFNVLFSGSGMYWNNSFLNQTLDDGLQFIFCHLSPDATVFLKSICERSVHIMST